MSEDELIALTVSCVVSLAAWFYWIRQTTATAPRCSRFRHRWPLLLYPALSAAALFGVLRQFSSHDVRSSVLYTGFYLILGAAWVGLAASWLLPLFGLSARDDVVERANPGAAHAIGGGLLGVTLCYAGGNIGDGPGWWVVVFCAGLSTAAFFLFWAFLDRFTGLADTVTVERDPAAGIRLAGIFTAAGLILGRAVAGDWESGASTLVDFAVLGWPALVLWAAAAVLESQLRPHHEKPRPDLFVHGLAPAAAYIGLAAFFVLRAGRWS
jgi:hypothetical protein